MSHGWRPNYICMNVNLAHVWLVTAFDRVIVVQLAVANIADELALILLVALFKMFTHIELVVQPAREFGLIAVHWPGDTLKINLVRWDGVGLISHKFIVRNGVSAVLLIIQMTLKFGF